MILKIDPEIWHGFPNLKVGILIGKGLNNELSVSKNLNLLRKSEETARRKYGDQDLGSVEKLTDWREAYRSFGYKPSSTRCSAESLLRRVVKGNSLPDINPIVNLYNSISLKYTLPAGADDLDRLEGDLKLVRAKGGERFVPLGGGEKEEAIVGEVIYRDDKDVTCKAWNYRECDKTKITAQTKNVLLVIEGLEHTTLGEMTTALKELKDLLQAECGGEYELFLLDNNHSEMNERTRLENWSIPMEIPEPDYHKQEAFLTRKAKLEEILEMGIDPYPAKFAPSQTVRDLQSKYASERVGSFEEAQEGSTEGSVVAGRLVLFRPMGANIFAQILDEVHTVQVLFNKEHTQVVGLNGHMQPIKFMEKKLDLGDFIGVKGHLFRTQKGELTLYAKEITLLCKALLPLPDKHKGIVDKGTRYRKRWLDLISHPEVGEQLRLRSQLIASIRNYFEQHGFLEVETPILQNIYGGAAAKPFKTHLHALEQEMFCRISLEISLKKLVIGGMHRVYEIGKVFRNEGIDRTHNPEFTMLESYAAYWDYNDVMTFTENLYERLALEIFGTTVIGERGDKSGKMHTIDLKTPWVRMSMKQAIKTYGGIEVDQLTDEQMRQQLAPHVDEAKWKEAPRGILIALLFEEFAEQHLIQPHHIIDHPIETTPLCKLHRHPKEREEGIVERFESFILGVECCNAYSELNDPILQRSLLEEQARMRESGEEEAHPMDEEFIEAICQGMPPCGGLGIGIDRLCMLFAGVPSIRDVLFFPVMRPEE